MIFGFNTNVEVENFVFHVQTEDRGSQHPVIDTTIYYQGRVLAKRDTSYKEFLESPAFHQDELKVMVERHHKKWVEIVKDRKLDEMEEIFQANTPVAIKVTLLNPKTIFHTEGIVIQAAVTKASNGEPISEANVHVQLCLPPNPSVELVRQTNGEGRVDVKLPMPKIGSEGAELIIEARAGQAHDTLRYTLRPKR